MAHVVVEWTDNLEGAFDLKALLHLIAADMRERSDGVFPVGGIRVRAIRLSDYVIADGASADDALINITVRMGAGRSAEFKIAYFDALFARVTEFLQDVSASRPFALSMYVDESEGWKLNTIHKRLAGTKP